MTIIVGAALVVVAEVVYCIIEGRADLAAIKNATDTASDAADKLGYDQVADIIDMAGDVADTLLDGATVGNIGKETEEDE